jgi:hypothetical protein
MMWIEELSDLEQIKALMNDKQVVKYQGTIDQIEPPLDGFYYLGGFVENKLVAIFLCYRLSPILLEGHLYATRESFGYFADLLKLAVKYVFERLGIVTVILRTPECYKGALAAVRKAGFIERGFVPSAFQYKEKLFGLKIFSITREGII